MPKMQNENKISTFKLVCNTGDCVAIIGKEISSIEYFSKVD